MRVLVAAWIGSSNLGDELVFAGLLRLLRAQGHDVTAISVDPPLTETVHGVPAILAHEPVAVVRAITGADAVVLGGGGLLQDETSPFNLPYHLWRVRLARARAVPYAGIGLGAGRLDTPLGRRQVRAAMAAAVAVTVRDDASARLLAEITVPSVPGADLAFALPGPQVAPQERIVVCLRPWTGRRGRRPAAWGPQPTPEPVLQASAAALDSLAHATGLAVHLVALQHDWDGPLHRAVAERMHAPVSFAEPTLDDLLAEVATGRLVVSMRYHGGVAAALAGRPAVLLGYSPKVDSLATQLGRGARLLPWSPEGPQGLAEAVASVSDDAAVEAVAAAVERLRALQAVHEGALETLAEAAARR